MPAICPAKVYHIRALIAVPPPAGVKVTLVPDNVVGYGSAPE
jgi:hypothetical protein